MQCIALVKDQRRCRNAAKFFLCPTHKKHPLVLLFLAISTLGLFAGLFQDVVKPLFSQGPSAAPAEPITSIILPLEIQSTWDADSTLSRVAQIYLVRPVTPVEDQVVFSGVARIEVPVDGGTLNQDIWVPGNRTIKTRLALPKSKALSRAFNEGGYELRVVVSNTYGNTFTHTATTIFDRDATKLPIRFWFRLLPLPAP